MSVSLPVFEHGVLIDAPVRSVFEYCRDPVRIYAGDPMYEITDVVVTRDGVGTRGRLAARMLVFVEEVGIEYVAVVPDQQIVFQGALAVTIAGLGRPTISFAVHIFTWTFEPEDGGTRLSLRVVEHDPPRWQRVVDRIAQKGFTKQVRARLARIKTRIEEQAATGR
jgi:uncharacterized protein YndB with AHSA1/START domain